MRALLAEVAGLLAASPRLDPESRADAAREARLLVAAVLDLSPGALAQRLGDACSPSVADMVRATALRRAAGEPLAYCTGAAPFRHLVLAVDGRVLIPRPETEILVDEVLRLTRAHPGGVAVDIGTGSGAIALALASEGRFERVIATDISTDALAVATGNAERLPVGAAPVSFVAGADLSPVAPALRGALARVIASNPPYIAYTEAAALPASVRDWEPAMALFAADDGMARYDALLAGAPFLLEPDGWLVVEVDARRAQETARRARASGYADVRLVRDLSDRERVLIARNSPSAGVVKKSQAATATTQHDRSSDASPTASRPETGEHARR